MDDIKDDEFVGTDGTIRKAHYGTGVQPFDIIVSMGWGPIFAASNVVKYMRRTKEPEHSLESARWYWARLTETANGVGAMAQAGRGMSDASWYLRTLRSILTADELARLRDA